MIAVLLDHIDGLQLPDELANSRYRNELQTLRHLAEGLSWLNKLVGECEAEAARRVPPGVSYFGRLPQYRDIPIGLVTTSFHWYAVTACNYVRLVGWLVNSEEKRERAAGRYVHRVIPKVQLWRDKVAGHFARHSPQNDGEATMFASVMHPVSLEDGRLVVGAMRVSMRRQGVASTSPDWRWSLTKTHELLSARYWPGES